MELNPPRWKSKRSKTKRDSKTYKVTPSQAVQQPQELAPVEPLFDVEVLDETETVEGYNVVDDGMGGKGFFGFKKVKHSLDTKKKKGNVSFAQQESEVQVLKHAQYVGPFKKNGRPISSAQMALPAGQLALPESEIQEVMKQQQEAVAGIQPNTSTVPVGKQLQAKNSEGQLTLASISPTIEKVLQPTGTLALVGEKPTAKQPATQSLGSKALGERAQVQSQAQVSEKQLQDQVLRNLAIQQSLKK